jgi:DNA adenine methylase
MSNLRAPFPWFGGKSRVADLAWSRLGDCPNYVEPFAGSLATLLNRPGWNGDGWQDGANRIETANDKDAYLANFWRALQAEPDGVAAWADGPVNECDLHARHWWLVNQVEFRARLNTDPDYYDAKIAGWWVWGICQWIGSGWCEHPERQKRPHLGDAGRGVHRPSQQLPHLGDAGMGVHRAGQAGEIYDYMHLLATRLRRVRVCCGDWSRVLGPTPTFKQGLTAVFLDPPYSAEAGRDETLYAMEDLEVAHKVRAWALENGDNPMLRIALCGYENEYEMPENWECLAWKANGGYSSQNYEGNGNPHRERIWFSPFCLKPERVSQMSLFEVAL